MTSVSTSAFYDSAVFNMTQLQKSTQALQTQISTGNQLTNSYDDPLAAAQMRTLQRADALATADNNVSDAAQTNLNLTDNTLSQFSKIVTEVQTLATQAANSTLSDAQRSSVGTQISAYYDQMVSLANTKDANGNALFGGQGTGSAYTLDASGNATYVGGASAAQATLGPNMTVTTGVTGPEFLDYTSGGTATNLLSVVKNLGTALSAEGTSTSATTAGATAATAANSALSQLSDGLNAITTSQTQVGARLNWITATTTMQTQFQTQRATSEANVGGTNMTTAIATLQQQMTVLEASQASFSKLSSLSLFNNLS